jgi:hypothetical protein
MDLLTKQVMVNNNTYDGAFLAVNNSKEVAQLAIDVYKNKISKALNISTASLRVEIYSHANMYQRKSSVDRSNSTNCGEGSIDDNRFSWDAKQDQPFYTIKESSF